VHARRLILAAAVLIAGCGSGGDGTGQAARPATAPKAEAIQPLIETCKQQIAARDYVPDRKKEHYYDVCQSAESGTAQGVRETTRDVCVDAEQKYLRSTPADRRQQIANCEGWLQP
jgi:hypothetical protein